MTFKKFIKSLKKYYDHIYFISKRYLNLSHYEIKNLDIDKVFMMYGKYIEDTDKKEIFDLQIHGYDVKKIQKYHKYLFLVSEKSQEKLEDFDKDKEGREVYMKLAQRRNG